MSLIFDAKRLEKALKDFYLATGVPMDLLKEDCTSVCVPLYGGKPYCDLIRQTREGRERCGEDNRTLMKECSENCRSYWKKCRQGLVHIGVPVMIDGEVLGYLAIGRFKTAEQLDLLPADPIADLPLEQEDMSRYYKELELFDEERAESVIALAEMLAEHLISAKIIKASNNTVLESIERYIDDNLSGDLSLDAITKQTHVSKSAIYRLFKENLGNTVTEYVSLKRVEAAVGLLIKTDLTVEEIAFACGFGSAPYFVSVFKSLKGLTPLQFRKQKFLTV